MRKENSTILIIIAVTTILIATIGASFAYFISRINIEQTGAKSSVNINTSTMAEIEYTSNSDNDSSSIEIENALPGKFGFIEFTLTATTKDELATAYYQIVWNINQNEFKYLDPNNGEVCEGDNCEAQLYYALYDGKVDINKTPHTDQAGNTYDIYGGVANGKIIDYNTQTAKNDVTDKTGEIVLDVGKLEAKKDAPASKTYTLIVWFEETNHNQNLNQGKILNGKIDVKLSDKEFE